MKFLALAIVLAVIPYAARAETAAVEGGQVTVPLSFYTQMVNQLSNMVQTECAFLFSYAASINQPERMIDLLFGFG